MLNPVSLMNMEMQLYGGVGMNSAAPSFVNNYQGCSNYLNQLYSTSPSFYGYNSANSTNFGQNIAQNYTGQTSNANTGTIFQGLNTSEANSLIKSYAKNLEYSQKLIPAIGSGAAFGALMMNPRIIAHPFNYLTTAFKGDTVDMFKGIKKNGALQDLWKKNHFIMEEAYAQMNRTEARHKSKLGLFRARYSDNDYNKLKGLMDKALKSGNIDEVAEATEKLRNAYTNNGYLPRFWNWITGKKPATVDMKLAETAKINDAVKTLKGYNTMTFKKAFQRSGGKFGLAFGAIELLLNFGKIQSAFEKDSKTGWKQLGQSTTKAVANTVGWALGETAAIWAGAKWGATIGTAFGPGVGTAVGAVIGMVGGSIGMWLFGKAARAAVGDDVANEIDAQKLAQTSEGQATIVQDLLKRAKDGEKFDPTTQQAIYKLGTLYA